MTSSRRAGHPRRARAFSPILGIALARFGLEYEIGSSQRVAAQADELSTDTGLGHLDTRVNRSHDSDTHVGRGNQ